MVQKVPVPPEGAVLKKACTAMQCLRKDSCLWKVPVRKVPFLPEKVPPQGPVPW